MNKTHNYSMPTDAEIAPYAYHAWHAEGRPPGKAMEYWLETRAQLIVARQHEAARSAAGGVADYDSPAGFPATAQPLLPATTGI